MLGLKTPTSWNGKKLIYEAICGGKVRGKIQLSISRAEKEASKRRLVTMKENGSFRSRMVRVIFFEKIHVVRIDGLEPSSIYRYRARRNRHGPSSRMLAALADSAATSISYGTYGRNFQKQNPNPRANPIRRSRSTPSKPKTAVCY